MRVPKIPNLQVFDWTIAKNLHILNFAPLYIRYNQKLRQEKTLQDLATFLTQQEPSIIVCHSLGCALFLSYVEWLNSQEKQIDPSIEKVVLLQGDIRHDYLEGRGQLLPERITLINGHYEGDYTLMLSSLLHLNMRAGLIGLKETSEQSVRNQRLLLRSRDPHNQILSNIDLLTDIIWGE
jgi:hypothetical protein